MGNQQIINKQHDKVWRTSSGIAPAEEQTQYFPSISKNTTLALSALSGVVLSMLSGQAQAIKGDSRKINTIANYCYSEEGKIVCGDSTTEATGALAIAIGKNSEASEESSIAYGNNAKAHAFESTVIGTRANSEGPQSIVIGSDSEITQNGGGGILIGNNLTLDKVSADGVGAISIGSGYVVTKGISSAPGADGDGDYSIAIGAAAEENSSYIPGAKTDKNAKYAIALGTNASVGSGSSSSIALGYNAQVEKIEGGVALGAKSKATIDKGVAGYDPLTNAASTNGSVVWKSTSASVSVGMDKNITRQITNVAAGTEDTDAVNVAQLKALAARIGSSGGGGGNVTIITNNVAAGDNVIATQAGGETVFSLAPDISLDSVTVGETVKLSADGIDAGNKQVINVAPGRITPNSKEAVNGAQLYDLRDQLQDELGAIDHRASAGVAAAMATGTLPQAYLPGKSMISAAAGHYRGQSALAIGVSSMSDNGRWIIKGAASATKDNFGVTVGVGYQW